MAKSQKTDIITPGALVPVTRSDIAINAGTSYGTRANSDADLLASWLDGLNSEVTRRKFAPTGERFLAELRARRLSIRTATIEDVREIINAMSLGKARSSAAQYAQRVKSILSYAHRLGFTAFNAGAAIRGNLGPCQRRHDRHLFPCAARSFIGLEAGRGHFSSRMTETTPAKRIKCMRNPKT